MINKNRTIQYGIAGLSAPVKGAVSTEWGAKPRESVTVKPEWDKSDT